MTQTAEAWLNDLTNLYIPTPTQFVAARSHRSSIEIRLDAHHGLHEMFEIGSLRHGTGVWIHSDADYMASLKGVPPSSPLTMLNKVKETLQSAPIRKEVRSGCCSEHLSKPTPGGASRAASSADGSHRELVRSGGWSGRPPGGG